MSKGKQRTDEEIKEILSSLIPIIRKTGSLRKACFHAEIPYESINRYRKQHEVVGMEITKAENFRQLLAETKVIEAIEKDDVSTAKWLLERVDKETYSTQMNQQTSAHIKVDKLSVEEEAVLKKAFSSVLGN